VSVQTRAKVVFFSFLPYFLVYYLVQTFITTSDYNFLTEIDKSIPFNPHFVWVYLTMIPVVGITLIFLIKRKDLFLSAIVAFLIATVILSFFYILLPAFYPRDGFVDNSTISGFLVELTKKLDGAQNTFPSSHVTFSWLITFFIGLSACAKKNKWLRIGFLIWASLITLSTLAIKQHFIVDALSGILLAYLCYIFSKKMVFEGLLKTN